MPAPKLSTKPRRLWRGFASAFTLAELLIALLILGEIATFTIPKIITSQANGRNNAAAKEVAGTIAGAFQQAQMLGIVSGSTNLGTLTPYINYVSVDTSTTIDDWQTGTSWGCSASIRCLVFHNGARVAYDPTDSFVGTSNTDFIEIQVDPDGVYSGTTNGAGKAVNFRLYYNGRLTTGGVANNNTAYDPPWFSW